MSEAARLSYSEAGATSPLDADWASRPTSFRAYEQTVLLGHGQLLWEEATSALVTWGVKTRSGFSVESVPPGTATAELGVDYRLFAALGPFRLREPVRVVSVVDEPTRCGFAYGTLEGHPVCGEEAFVIHRDAEGAVWLTLRSLTRSGVGIWRLAFPAVIVAQQWYRRRYLRALRHLGG